MNFILSIALSFFLAFSAAAAGPLSLEEAEPSLAWRYTRQEREPGFQRSYWQLGVTRNFGAGAASTDLGPGRVMPALGLRYILSAHWLAGLGAQIRSLTFSPGERQLAIITLSEEIGYIEPIYRPFFAILSCKVHYLVPSERITPPLSRPPELGPELGVGLNFSLLYRNSEHSTLELSAERWRGTASNKLHAFELRMTAGLNFD